MKLVVAESAIRANRLRSFISSPDWVVLSSFGDPKVFPKALKDLCIGGGPDFPMDLVPNSSSVIKNLEDHAKEAKEVWIVCLNSRAGAGWASLISEVVSPFCDSVFFGFLKEVTPAAISSALKIPHELDPNMVASWKAQKACARLSAYLRAPVLKRWLGRTEIPSQVQGCVLKELVTRDRLIRAQDTPTLFQSNAPIAWRVRGQLPQGQAAWSPPLNTKKGADDLVKKLQSSELSITQNIKSEVVEPPLGFNTVSLIRTAHKYKGWSPSVTMKMAEMLWDKGMISSPWTTGTHLSPSVHTNIRKLVLKLCGPNGAPDKPRDSPNGERAITPCDPTRMPSQFIASRDMRALYSLIWMRSVASVGSNATRAITQVDFSIKKKVVLSAIGERLDNKGWHTPSCETFKPPDTPIASFTLGDFDVVPVQKVLPKHHDYSSLVQWMDNNHIGTPASFAPVLAGLIESRLVRKTKTSLKVTTRGESVASWMDHTAPELVSVESTKEHVQDLERVQKGEQSFGDVFEKQRQLLVHFVDNTPKQKMTVEVSCGRCNNPFEFQMDSLKKDPCLWCSTCKEWQRLEFDANGLVKVQQ